MRRRKTASVTDRPAQPVLRALDSWYSARILTRQHWYESPWRRRHSLGVGLAPAGVDMSFITASSVGVPWNAAGTLNSSHFSAAAILLHLVMDWPRLGSWHGRSMLRRCVSYYQNQAAMSYLIESSALAIMVSTADNQQVSATSTYSIATEAHIRASQTPIAFPRTRELTERGTLKDLSCGSVCARHCVLARHSPRNAAMHHQ